ncbi:MAG: TIGR02587 family membrane protein [Jaaginema sp. PMC 1079.18]|nr:TIGR02587 family membrane protein [Jaaginema sp. PMC 1080.18]MEC4852189.1 TIGR02587 family membrane protein [Jaaginema sp. PMC 1079.18]MEC4865030.1 TIGR02587 family membrane protein [Jaaginema sp. PMC 1078.18]
MKQRRSSLRRPSPWKRELKELAGGASGGFLFGIPLLYTLEVWSIGSYVQPPILLAVLGLTFVAIFLLNQVEGFRRSRRSSLLDAAAESVEAIALGLICATAILVLLQRITPTTSLMESLGKIVFETIPFAVGVTLSQVILSGEPQFQTKAESQKKMQTSHPKVIRNSFNFLETFTDLSATVIGALIIGFSIAPTDEVSLLAAPTSPPWLLAIMGTSLLISYSIVFTSGFTDQSKRQQQKGIFQHPLAETVFSYLVALIMSALMLWFFQRLSFQDPFLLWIRQTIILGLPASIGGAAGRLAV